MPEGREQSEFDAIVIGAGFSGLYMLHRLRQLGMSVKVIEAASDIGGVWYWNRYPGARCDVESIHYSYSFDEGLQQEWKWTEKYAAQEEILRYINHVAERFDLRSDIQFDTKIVSARFDEGSNLWTLLSDGGEEFRCRNCITAVGALSEVNPPPFPGLDDFEGDVYMTARWPHEGVDFAGRRVAVIGTGSSGIQTIPVVAAEAAHTTVFQRSPNFAIPSRNHALDDEYRDGVIAEYPRYRKAAREAAWGVPMDRELHPFAEFTPEERQKLLEDGWAEGGASGALRSFSDTMTNEEANRVVADFVRERIREKVDDPEVAENLLPVDHPLGSKRLCLDTDYFEAYNRDNVDLVNLRKDPIEAITPKGIKAGGTEYEVDAIIFALGFDAVTGALRAIDIYDTEGVTLRERWDDGPETYLGLSVVGFPNFFALTGPGSPAVLGNAIVAIEIQVEWVAATIEHLRDAHLARIEPTAEAARGWTNHAAEVAEQTLFIKAKSWFLGSNIPGKPRVFLPYAGGMARYRETLEAVAQKGYDGFVLRDDSGRTSSDPGSVSVGSN